MTGRFSFAYLGFFHDGVDTSGLVATQLQVLSTPPL